MGEFDPLKYERDLKNIRSQFSAQELLYTSRKWRAYINAAHLNIANTTITTVQFDTIDFDCDGVGLSSNGYPAQERGFLFVIGRVLWRSVSDQDEYRLYIWNATTGNYYDIDVRRHSGGTSNTIYLSCQCTALVPVDVGDVVNLRVYHNDGSNNPDILGGNRYYSFLEVFMLTRRCP